MLVIDKTDVSIVTDVVLLILKIEILVIFKGSHECLELCLIVIENGLICEDHDLLEEMLLLLDLSELLGYYHEDTKVVLSHLVLQLLHDFRETEVLNEIVDWNVDRGDANTLEALVSLLDVIKSFVIFDQVVEATEFDVLLDIILVDLAALEVLLWTLVVVVGQLLEHLLV